MRGVDNTSHLRQDSTQKDEQHQRRKTVIKMEYRGFVVYFSKTNNAYNAKPTDETKVKHPEYAPIASPTMEDLTSVLDYQIDGV